MFEHAAGYINKFKLGLTSCGEQAAGYINQFNLSLTSCGAEDEGLLLEEEDTVVHACCFDEARGGVNGYLCDTGRG